jgi:hypothetical protein
MNVASGSETTATAQAAPRVCLSVNSIEVIYDHVILVLKGVSLDVLKAASSHCSARTAPARRRR